MEASVNHSFKGCCPHALGCKWHVEDYVVLWKVRTTSRGNVVVSWPSCATSNIDSAFCQSLQPRKRRCMNGQTRTSLRKHNCSALS